MCQRVALPRRTFNVRFVQTSALSAAAVLDYSVYELTLDQAMFYLPVMSVVRLVIAYPPSEYSGTYTNCSEHDSDCTSSLTARTPFDKVLFKQPCINDYKVDGRSTSY